jgi:DNA/RNA-binding domain of Phe-tRNA-synthetase-like protein
LKNLLLTAGHDLDSIDGDLEVDVASGSERYTTLSGKDQILKAKDMFIHDGEGILSSILYGPDSRTPIRPATRRVVFTVYAPAGISEPRLEAHLGDLRRFVQTVEPEATVDQLQVVRA